jgi:hypothetical protein
MGLPAKIQGFPVEIQQELDRALIDNGFTGYKALADSLTKRGYTVSCSAVHRYGKQLENLLELAHTVDRLMSGGVSQSVAIELTAALAKATTP